MRGLARLAAAFAAGIVVTLLAVAGVGWVLARSHDIVDVGTIDDFPIGSVTTFYVLGRDDRGAVAQCVWPCERPPGRSLNDGARAVRPRFEFHLVRIAPDDLVAFLAEEPHGGCHIPWRPDFVFEGTQGWFRDGCGGSTFTIEGKRVFGPSPRDLDRLPVTIRNGRVYVTADRKAVIEATPVPTSSSAAETPTRVPTPPPPATAPPTPQGTPSQTPAPTPVPESPRLFADPRPREPDRRVTVPPRPPSPFAPWNGGDVVLYDRITMTELNFGPGAFASFSPDGRLMAWARGDNSDFRELILLNLSTQEQRTLGNARYVRWVDQQTLFVFLRGGNEAELVDVESGARRQAGTITSNPDLPAQEADGWRLATRAWSPATPAWRHEFTLSNTTAVREPIEFTALAASLSPDGHLFVVLPPDDQLQATPDLNLFTGLSNLYEIDPATGRTDHLTAGLVNDGSLRPLVSSRTHVVWTDNACQYSSDVPRRTKVLDRRTGQITELNEGFWVYMTPDGALGVGVFGPTALIDIASLQYTFVLPPDAADVRWTTDYRYAALSHVFGHGGPCR